MPKKNPSAPKPCSPAVTAAPFMTATLSSVLAAAATRPSSRCACAAEEEHPGKLTRCVSCGAAGRRFSGNYREPARPVRATTVADVHVLAQSMIHRAERRRLLVFADNRQDAALQAGWMQDRRSRRCRFRELIYQKLKHGLISVSDLTQWLDQHLDADDELSRALIPEVWRVEPKSLRRAKLTVRNASGSCGADSARTGHRWPSTPGPGADGPVEGGLPGSGR